jgi:hypothetical protein
MQQLQVRSINPFAVTRAVDLTDEEIQDLWVSVGADEGSPVFRPTSPMPLILLGGKGSGKTHWMRYHSFPLQRLRYESASLACLDGLAQDGYLGIYILLGSLNAERFSERDQSDHVWKSLFAYYFELWAAQELLQIVASLPNDEPQIAALEKEICSAVLSLMDPPPEYTIDTLSSCLDWLSSLQSQIDRIIANIIFQPTFDIRIRVTPGKLIFGIPKILSRKIASFRRLVFSYQLDEFEILSEVQQRHINTLIRDRSLPSTFRIGGRLWSIKTRSTFANNEENKEGSEFETWYLDRRFRQSKAKWTQFSYKLIQRRMEVSGTVGAEKIARAQIDNMFEVPQLSWDSPFIKERVGQSRASTNGYLAKLQRKLEIGRRAGASPGVMSISHITKILDQVTVPEYPLLEKVNILLLYQAWFRGDDLIVRATNVHSECYRFLQRPHRMSKYQRAVQHYGSDLLAQLFREERKRQSLHYGMKNFIRMSEGLPRSLLILLKEVFDWAIYNSTGQAIYKIPIRDQDLGLLDGAEWFLTTMTKSGEHEPAVITAIERIGRLFETNRFADKPIECSLLGFGIRERDLLPLTQERLRLAEQHSFLMRIAGGEIDRNTRERLSKFQLNALVGPKWDLPAARRGIARLKPQDLDIIFDPSKEADFEAFHRKWAERMTAPFFGRRHETERGLTLFGSLP